jgi:hypothetical protein
MTKRISELPAAGGVADTDELELNQAGASRKATRGQIVAGLASAFHQHDLADIGDAGALAALDAVGTAEIDAATYASQSEAVAGTDSAKIMTALRTAEAIAAKAAPQEHQHGLADISDAGALAALDAVRPTEIDSSAYATQVDAIEGIDGTRIMTPGRTAEAIAAKAAPHNHQHELADIVDAGALAALDAVGTAEIAVAAYASQAEAVAGTDDAKIMTALRVAEAIAVHPAGEHQHTLADITDAGALAALDAVGTAEIAPGAYASQSQAVAGTDEAKLMTALRTAEAIAARAAPPGHQHDLADIADAGALAALDAVGTAEIAVAAYASQAEAVAGTDDTKIMTPLRTVQAITAHPAGEHQHDLVDIIDAGALAALDAVGTAEIAAAAYASQSEAVAGTDNAKLMTALRTAEAIAAQAVSPEHQHNLADITDAGALAALDAIRTTEIDPSAYATQADAAEGIDGTRIMTAVRTAEAIAAKAAPQDHQHSIADITDAGALAALDAIGTAEIAAAAYASQGDAVAGTDNAKIMTALRVAEAIAAHPAGEHEHTLADLTDAGALAALDAVGTAEIAAAAYASEAVAVAGTDQTKLMTALRTAEAIAARAAPPGHQHDLADITDAGALAALDAVGTTEIAAAAYASQVEAVAGTDSTKIMTPLRTAQAIAAHPAGEHQHTLADIADAGALAALDAVGTAEIAAAAYASQSEAVAGTDNTKLMTALRTAEAIAAHAVDPEHQHSLADIADAGALAALDAIRPTEIDPSAYATQNDAAEGLDGTRIMTAIRTAEAIAAQAAPQDHQHDLADVAGAGALAALDVVSANHIATNAVTSNKILALAVTTAKFDNAAVTQEKIADGAIVADKIAANAVIAAKLADAAVTQQKIADGAVGASKLQPGIPINMQDALLTGPELRDYCETSPAPTISSGTLTLDLETGSVFEVILTQNVTSVVLAHPPAAGRAGSCSIILRQDATGGRTLSWPTSIKWAGGAPPPITTAAGAVDVFGLITRDGGQNWFGFPAGQNFS